MLPSRIVGGFTSAFTLFLLVAPGWAQRDLTLEPLGRRKVALVIGNNAYGKASLKNAVNDARVVAQTLQDSGFKAEALTDADAKSMEAGVNRLVSQISPGDVALFYFAGHGMQIDGENYLIPTDFAGDEADVKYRTLAASWVQDKLDKAGAGLKIMILDACRTNPYRVTRGGPGGLAQMQGGRGSFVAFATAAGKVANDNVQDSNGLFTKNLVAALKLPGLTLDEVFNRAREDVDRESAGQQLPYIYSGVIGKFYFRPPAITAEKSSGAPTKLVLDPNAYYRLVARHSDKCLDMRAENGILQQYNCLGNSQRQAFRFALRPDGSYSLIMKEPSNACLDVVLALEEDGAFIVAFGCRAGLNQEFQLKPAGEGYFMLVAKHSNKCISVVNGSRLANMLALQWECLGTDKGAHQQFRIEPWPGK